MISTLDIETALLVGYGRREFREIKGALLEVTSIQIVFFLEEALLLINELSHDTQTSSHPAFPQRYLCPISCHPSP